MTARRDFLAFAAGAVAARTVLPAAARASETKGAQSEPHSNPDAELLRLCRAFTETTAELRHNNTIDDDDEERDNAVSDAWWASLEAIIPMAAKTPTGIHAKALVLRATLLELAVIGDDGDIMEDGDPEAKLAWSLVRDIIAMGAGA